MVADAQWVGNQTEFGAWTVCFRAAISYSCRTGLGRRQAVYADLPLASMTAAALQSAL